MTPHPQCRYIITEEQLRDIIYFAYVDLKDEDKIHEGIGELIKTIRSRPAPTEQEICEKVLNKIFKWLCDMDGGDVVLNFKLGLYSSPQPFNSTGLIHKLIELRTTPEAHR